MIFHHPIPPTSSADVINTRVLDTIGSTVEVSFVGAGLSVLIGSSACTLVSSSGTKSVFKTPAKTAGTYNLVVNGTVYGTVEVWTPTTIGAVLYDPAVGVTTSTAGEIRRWSMLTESMPASWLHRDGPALIYVPNTGKYWLFGGWNPTTDDVNSEFYSQRPGWLLDHSTNEIWSSPDCITWTLEKPHDQSDTTRWDARHYFGCVMWNNRVWVVGGDYTKNFVAGPKTYHKDVWSSADCLTWTKHSDLPWPAPRFLHVVGTYKGRLYTFGGQIGMHSDGVTAYNDLYSTADGVTWRLDIANDPSPAAGVQPTPRGTVDLMVEFNDRLWLFSGAVQTPLDPPLDVFFTETWSTNGTSWTQHAAPPWGGRKYHSVRVLDGRMWVIVGYNYGGTGNLRELWWTDDGVTWHEDPIEHYLFDQSHADGVAVKDNTMTTVGGSHTIGNRFDSEVWQMDLIKGNLVESWAPRTSGPTLYPSGDSHPIKSGGRVCFDGFKQYLLAPAAQACPSGYSVFFKGETYLRPDRLYHSDRNAKDTIVSNSNNGISMTSVGFEDGKAAFISGAGAGGTAVPDRVLVSPAVVGIRPSTITSGWTHATDGTLKGYLGTSQSFSGSYGYDGAYDGWDVVGTGSALADKFAGNMNFVMMFSRDVTAAESQKILQWAIGK